MESRRIGGSISDKGKSLFPTSHVASRLAVLLAEPFVQWVPGGHSLWLRRHGCEVGHLPASCGEINNAWSCISIPPCVLRVYVGSTRVHAGQFV